MDHHNDTTMYSKANIWYIHHNMYLVNQSITYIYLYNGNHISYIYQKLITTKSHLTSV